MGNLSWRKKEFVDLWDKYRHLNQWVYLFIIM